MSETNNITRTYIAETISGKLSSITYIELDKSARKERMLKATDAGFVALHKEMHKFSKIQDATSCTLTIPPSGELAAKKLNVVSSGPEANAVVSDLISLAVLPQREDKSLPVAQAKCSWKIQPAAPQ